MRPPLSAAPPRPKKDGDADKYIAPVPAMQWEPSNHRDGQLQLSNGYLRPRAYAMSRDMGQTIVLNTGSALDYNKPKMASTRQRSDEEMKDIFMSSCKEQAKRKQEHRASATTKSEPKSVNPNPQEWLAAPWRSAHDGMCQSRSLAWKWNEAPSLAPRKGPKVDATKMRQRSRTTGASEYRDSYHHLGAYQPQTPQNLVPIPNLPVWQRHEATISQQRYFHKPLYNLTPELTLLKWGSLKFSNGGHGSSM